MQKTRFSAFLAGFVAGALALGVALALANTRPAEAQASVYPNEQVEIMREMSWSLKGIDEALRQKCP